MPKSPSWAKNAVKQVLWTAIDRELWESEITALWSYFGSGCAYCGAPIFPKNKSAHKDHLLPVERGGTNHISNRVLACAGCNEKDKRDASWEEFLKLKAPDARIFEERKRKIDDWIGLNLASFVPVLPAVRAAWRQEKERLAAEIDLSLERLRATRA